MIQAQRPGMNVKLARCTLTVHDLDEAVGFYRDVLGFKVSAAVGTDGTRWVSVSPPAQPDMRIVLEPADRSGSTTPADRRAIEDLLADGLLGRLVFVTDDCDAAFAHLEAAGAEVMKEPGNRESGVRDCAFRDPSGNLLHFSAPVG